MDVFVHRPALYLGIAGVLALLGCLKWFTGFGAGRSLRPLWWAAAAWALGGLWEYVVMTRTPEADIRVDLLILLPGLAILSLWSLFKVLR